MAHSPRVLRIIAASVLALVMVGGSYAISGPISFLSANIADAQSSEELLKEYAAKDTDSDGLPDWQEALYGTDHANPESFQAGLKDGDAVAQGLIEPKVTVREKEGTTDIASIPGKAAAPDTLTDRFAQTLLKQYLANRGDTAPTAADIVSFVQAGVQNLSAETALSDTYALVDVKASGTSGAAALTTYAAQMEAAFAQNTVAAEKNELFYFEDAIRNDSSALKKISNISKAYKNIAKAVMALSVPNEVRQAHLAIANALMHMSEISGDMAAMDSDPLRALMGIGLHERYATELVGAFANLSGLFTARQVVIPEGSAGHFIVKTSAAAAAAK